MDKETALILLRSEQMTVRRYLELAEENGWNAYPSDSLDPPPRFTTNGDLLMPVGVRSWAAVDRQWMIEAIELQKKVSGKKT